MENSCELKSFETLDGYLYGENPEAGKTIRLIPFGTYHDAVTLNGIPLPQLNIMTEPYVGKWCLIGANGRAVDSASGSGRPHVYGSLEQAVADAESLERSGEYSTCGGVAAKGGGA